MGYAEWCTGISKKKTVGFSSQKLVKYGELWCWLFLGSLNKKERELLGHLQERARSSHSCGLYIKKLKEFPLFYVLIGRK